MARGLLTASLSPCRSSPRYSPTQDIGPPDARDWLDWSHSQGTSFRVVHNRACSGRSARRKVIAQRMRGPARERRHLASYIGSLYLPAEVICHMRASVSTAQEPAHAMSGDNKRSLMRCCGGTNRRTIEEAAWSSPESRRHTFGADARYHILCQLRGQYLEPAALLQAWSGEARDQQPVGLGECVGGLRAR